MWPMLLRLAMMGGAVLFAWNLATEVGRLLRKPKTPEALPPANREEAAARDMCAAALEKTTAIEMAIAPLGDGVLWNRAEGFSFAVNKLTDAVLADPSRYRRARRHLTQILFGAKHAAKHFAKLYAASPNEEARDNFVSLLDDLTAAYQKAAEQYAEAGYADLEIEEDVLRELVEKADP